LPGKAVQHDEIVEVVLTSPEGEVALHLPFDQMVSLDEVARDGLRKVAHWARQIELAAH
jgi:hypothetical protein